ALERAERAVELHPEATVDVDLAGVVLPRDAEDDLALGLADALDDLELPELGVLLEHRAEGAQHLRHRLVELGFTTVAPRHLFQDRLEALIDRALNVCHHVAEPTERGGRFPNPGAGTRIRAPPRRAPTL